MRSLLAGVLLLVGAVLVPVTTTAWWLRSDVVSTDGYAETVAPLATDPAVVAAVEGRLTDATLRSVDRSGGLDRVPGLRDRIEQLVRVAVAAVVADPSFQDAWTAANRAAHAQVVAALAGEDSAVRTGPNGTVEIELSTLTDALRDQLTEAGVPFASALPEVQATYPVGDVQDLQRAQVGYQALERWGPVLPFVTAALIGLGLLVARNRRRALAWTALLALLGLGLTFLGLVGGRAVYLDSVPTTVPQPAAKAYFDTVTSGLRHDLGWVAIGCAAALLLAALFGGRRREVRDDWSDWD
ncbi:MAG: hypothetical protein HOQ22_15165 [Nocardioidaceae bacterium]|nr:hypothetical protein [Nocardioidaceae bacterium]NUS52367.1 hypothetical protein [Nocardioidaceae bacterium]